VKDEIEEALMPFFSKVARVHPVERISTPNSVSPLAKSTIPVLSETLMTARLTFNILFLSLSLIPPQIPL